MANQSALSKYQKLTDREHILKKPDTYIGSIENTEHEDYIFNDEKIISKGFQYIPGLYKLFDEGIVNCRDHVIRQEQAVSSKIENALPVSNIEINVDDDGTIHMYNDGNGIDVAEHPEYKMWIPEMIFGHLRTSTNYDEKKKEKIVGGKNGFGFKLVLIWSTWGKVETVDHIRGLKYVQEFKNNLTEICKPSIKKCKVKPYTRVSFKPDYQRLGIENLTPDMLALFKKRVYDISAVTDKRIKVKYNGELVPCKNFEQYVDLYVGNKTDTKRIYENHNGQIIRKLCVYIKTKKKVDVKPNTIKEQLMLFLRCDIDNPSFNSQTKDELGTASTKFGSTCSVSDNFIEKIAKMGVMNAACALTEVKDNKAAKKTDGSKSKSIRGIHKLIDANFAGTVKSKQCTLILCEGDSAKAGIVSGLSKDDRNTIGVYPMKGKIFNVRGESLKRINENKEIIEIKQILGLETGKTYTSESAEKCLRYNSVLFMTDQDLDGSHIKGLGLNLFQDQWNSLSTLDNFLGFMNTPILKAKKNGQEKLFYNEGEYNLWKQENDTKGWNVKYYKGLGTSTGKEFKEYFANKKIVYFNHEGSVSDNIIDMIFNKKRSEERKGWLSNYDRNSYLDTDSNKVSHKDFINKEMIHFSIYDCERSIPNLMDGLKTSLRKILYSSFKKNLTTEIKVAQFSGYVSEHSGYHHGEASLNGAIVGMAQDYVGSNNVNLLLPNGQFGTRLQGGKDSASERYIFTQLNQITRYIYRKEDDPVLEYLEDDGDPVEPRYYVPIVPMILVNGGKGIGTGFSTDILSYNINNIIDILKFKLQLTETEIELSPFYKNFEGSCEKTDDKKYIVKGVYEKITDKKIKIKELPIGYWTDDFKQHIENLMEVDKNKKQKTFIKDYNDMSTDRVVDFEIVLNEPIDESKDSSNVYNNFEKTMKLYSTLSTNNMHLFNDEEKLTKYSDVKEIIDSYFPIRLEYYQKRKDHQIATMEEDVNLLQNKSKFIMENIKGTIDLRNKKKTVIIEMLTEKGYDKLDGEKYDPDYKYLLKMPMDSLTEENFNKMCQDKDNKITELEKLKSTAIEHMWLSELEELKTQMAIPSAIKIKKKTKK